jgi:hypothetical protein
MSLKKSPERLALSKRKQRSKPWAGLLLKPRSKKVMTLVSICSMLLISSKHTMPSGSKSMLIRNGRRRKLILMLYMMHATNRSLPMEISQGS